MNSKKQSILLLVISLLVLVIGISYAYYSAVVQGTGNTNAETSANTATLGEVEFNGTSTFDSSTLDDIYPGFIGIQTFTIGPYKDGPGIYEIDLQANVPAAFGSDIKITVYKTSDATNNNIDSEEGTLTQNNIGFFKQDTLTITGTLEKVYEETLTQTTETMIEQVEFTIANNAFTTPVVTPDGYYTYYAVYEYISRDTSQNSQQNLDFDSKITVKYISEKTKFAAETILELVGDADPTSTAVINKGTDASGCTNTLAYDDFGNLRYVGSNPCNYVTFNGETAGWRIIGVFDNQIKLIRSESIGKYSWDTSASNVNRGYGINQWGESETYTGADLMKLLNPGYDNNLAEDASGNTISGTYANNSLYWNKGTGNCYNKRNNAYTTCDFSATGLTESAKTMIANSTWNLGSYARTTYTHNNIKAKPFYELERSNNNGKICSSGSYCNDTVNRTTTWEGYVGLMYPSDYGYAVGGEARTNCLANTNLYNYDTNNCYTNDWLYKTSTYQWTLSPYADSSRAYYVFAVYSGGYVGGYNASDGISVRPALFLIPSIEISGEGTPSTPFTLSVG